MSRPIKVSDELYTRLQKIAEAEGATLQDALFSLVEERAEEMVRFETELYALKARLVPAADAVDRLTAELERVASTLLSVQATTRALSELRGKDIAALNSWVEAWQTIKVLEDTVEDLNARVDAAESKAHEHFWQSA